MQAVMYHYVRPTARTTERAPNGYYHLSLADFRRQLDWLEANRTLIDRGTFLDGLSGERAPPENAVVLTFDDGLADHYEFVLPELEARGLWGAFFVPTGPLVDGRALAVHRVHALVGRYEAEALYAALSEALSERGLDSGPAGDAYGRPDTNEAVGAFKQLLNFEVPYEHVDSVLNDVERRFDHAIDVAEYYLSVDGLRELADAGNLVGAHSISHPVLSRLSAAEQRTEIVSSFDALAERLGEAPLCLFAYPYGSEETFDDRTKRVLRNAGCTSAFTTVAGDIDANSLDSAPLSLPRRDCNEFPHGGATFDLS